MTSQIKRIKITQQDILFFSLLALVILLRGFVLAGFSFHIFDSDQTIMWNAAIDYSRGIFHEPRFYGQSYNTMLEALLAVPLIWLSVPVYFALPLVTSILALFPFLLIAFLARSRGRTMEACIVLLIPLLLPTEYSFLTSLPRGFVTGIFVASLGAVWVYTPLSRKGWFLFGLFGMLGYSVNQNSFLIAAPVMLFLWLENIRNLRFYLTVGAGILTGLVFHLLALLFYVLHPGYDVHPLPRFMMAIDLFLDAVMHLDRHLAWVTPLFNSGLMVLFLFAMAGTTLAYQKKRTAALTAFASLALILLTLSLKQMVMSTDSVFYSYARMYLAVPVLLAFLVPFIEIPFRRGYMVLLVMAFGLCMARVEDIAPGYDRVLAPGISHIVSVSKLETFRNKCQQVRDYARQLNITLVVEDHDYFYDFINYGCSTCSGNFPATLRPAYERRTWRLQEEKSTVHENIMIIDFSYHLGGELHQLDGSGVRYFNFQGFYFILGNKVPTLQLLKTLSIGIRSF